MTEELLKKPDYVDNDAIGRMIALYCKVCGTQIGADQRGNFFRGSNYAEMKIMWADGSKHVTQLCSDCVVAASNSPDVMLAMYNADIDDMVKSVPQMEAHREKFDPVCVAIELKRRGIP